MATPVQETWQPMWGSSLIVAVPSTASGTNSTTIATCNAVRIAAGGAALWFSFTASASAAGTQTMFLPANTSIILVTEGGHTINFKADVSANPMMVNVTPLR